MMPVEPTGPCGAINPDTGDVCALTVGHARHHLSAAQREERQHRAASELTRHDTNAGHYGITVTTMPDTLIHGPWDKEQQRYADGCKSDARPHSTDQHGPHGGLT